MLGRAFLVEDQTFTDYRKNMTTDWTVKVEAALARIREESPTTTGCSEDTLATFERQHQLALPAAYRCFLASAGMNPGDFLDGSDLRFDELAGLQSSARSLLEENGAPPLPSNAFVFCEHQGYQFLFFHLGESEDPTVHYYLELSGEFKVVASTFSDWLVGAVNDEFPSGA
jgi:hypothetical protein